MEFRGKYHKEKVVIFVDHLVEFTQQLLRLFLQLLFLSLQLFWPSVELVKDVIADQPLASIRLVLERRTDKTDNRRGYF